jgi:dUTP pyrophosphatase
VYKFNVIAGLTDVWDDINFYDKTYKKFHPTQKPYKLIERIIQCSSNEGDIVLDPFKRVLVPTGLYFELEKGTEIQVRPRSGLAIKHGITVLNTPGTVDSHYRGEVKVPLINLGEEPYLIQKGDRIAQAVIMPVFGEGRVILTKTDGINETIRGDGGFNSSGIK